MPALDGNGSRNEGESVRLQASSDPGYPDRSLCWQVKRLAMRRHAANGLPTAGALAS